MTSKTLKSAIWLTLAASAVALAAPGGGGGGGGGNKPPTEAGFNLSVPAIMVGGTGKFLLNCPSDAWSELTLPSKPPVFYEAACALTHDGEVCVDEGYYFVQRDGVWQAPCRLFDSINAKGAWGDNLAGEAMLKVGSPIRVELVLWDASGQSSGQQGYKVIKLEPAELDRLSDYGHLAEESGGELIAKAVNVGAIVHDPAATLTIQRMLNGSPYGAPEFDGPAGGEINATGKIVYGYNLRVAEPGTYRITYTLPSVMLDPCDKGFCAGHEAYLDIEVVQGGGGGGGKGGGKGGGRPIKPGK